MQIDWSKIFSYINNSADRKTIEEVESWRKEDAQNENFFQRASHYYKNTPTRNESFSGEQLNVLYAKTIKGKQRKRQRVLWRQMSVAASAILLISIGIWWYYTGSSHEGDVTRLAAAYPAPVTEVIVVTESGDKFTTEQLHSDVVRQVSSNKLEYFVSDSTSSADTAHVEKQIPKHTIIVPRGRTFELVLSDGTFVLLAPSSELTYPVQFDSCSAREVTLRGEAYFEVTKSSNRFAVNTNCMKLQVYGTTFNVLAREGTPDETVLLEGVVGITPNNVPEGKETVLRPGDKSSVNEAGQVSVAQTDLTEYVAKRNGYILFNGKRIGEIIHSLELYYDVDFIIDDVVLGTQEYVFSIKRDASLREALGAIESVADVKFVIEGKEVKIISK